MVSGVNGVHLHIEAGHIERPGAPLAGLRIFEQWPDLLGRRPDEKDPRLRRRYRIVAGEHSGLRQVHIVEPRLPGQDVETHPLMQEFDQPHLRRETTTGSVARLAQLHHARGTNGIDQRLQIAEVLIRGIDRAYRGGVFNDPFL